MQNGRKVGAHVASILCLVAYSFRVEVSPDTQEVDITLMPTYRKRLAALQPDLELVPWKRKPPPHPHTASHC